MNCSKTTVFLVLACLLFSACTPKFSSWYLTTNDIQIQELPASKVTKKNAIQLYRGPCQDPLNYIPDTLHYDHTPIKYARVNFHWMNSRDTAHNLGGREPIKYTESLLWQANDDLSKNYKLWLPHKNKIPVIKPRFRTQKIAHPDYPEQNGIYFHYDDTLSYFINKGKNKNNYKKDVIKKYGIQLDSVINAFVLPHHPDSMASPTYKGHSSGIALGNAIKLSGVYEHNQDPWYYRGSYNHEIGHIFGLGHAWTRDGCKDTQEHKSPCWSKSSKPPCDTQATNNMMDYNEHQNALSPCQIGKLHLNMARLKGRSRKYLVKNWCSLDEKQHIIIKDSIVWSCMKDLEGHLTIQNGGHLTLKCRTSFPKNAKITVQAGGTLVLDNAWLHNSCGDQWLGIEIQQVGKLKGQVIYIGEVKVEDIVNIIE